MPFPYSPASTVAAANPNIPDGPVGSAATWKAVLDARNLTLGSLGLGHLLWSGDFAVEGSAPNNFTVTLGAISSIVLYDGTNYRPFATSGDTATQANVAGGTLGVAANWWYVYAYVTGGSIAYEITQTEPSAARVFKTDTSTHRYLGCFRTNGSGVPIAIRASRGRYVYRAHQTIATLTTAGVDTTQSAAAYVPPHARIATIELYLARGTHATLNGAYLYGNASASSVAMQLNAPNLGGVSYYQTGRAEVELTSSQQFAYRLFDNSGADASLESLACGWQE